MNFDNRTINRNPQRHAITRTFFYFSVTMLPVLAYFDLLDKYYLMATAEIFTSLVSLYVIFSGTLNKSKENALSIAVNLFFFIMVSGLPYIFDDIQNFLWMGLFPFFLFYLGGNKQGTILSILYGFFLIFFYFLWPYLQDAERISPLEMIKSTIIYASSTLLAFIYESQRNNYEKKLMDMAEHDTLTNLLNRRGLYRILDHLEGNIARGINISAIIVDIDFFKKINDTYGHNIGDEIIIKVAREIKKAVRKNDWVVRWGGEEFLILIEKTDINQAFSVAEKIRKNLSRMKHRIVKRTTVSLGVSQFISNFNDLFKKADEALYIAKNEGRNCTRCSE